MNQTNGYIDNQTCGYIDNQTSGYIDNQTSGHIDNQNNSSTDIAAFTPRIDRYIGSSFLAIILVVGVVLNVLILISAGFARRELKPYHYYIVNISLADLFFVLTQIPLLWYMLLFGQFPFDRKWMTIAFLSCMTLYSVTFITHALIAVNRLIGCFLSFSTKASIFISARATCVIILLIWAWSIGFPALPIITNYVDLSFIREIDIVDVHFDNGQRALYFWIYMSSLGQWIPLLTIIISYSFICIRIRQSGQLFSHPIVHANYVKATRYMFVVSNVFLACWLPITIQTLVEMSSGATSVLIFRICFFTFHLRVLINPIIYAWKIRQFRRGLLCAGRFDNTEGVHARGPASSKDTLASCEISMRAMRRY